MAESVLIIILLISAFVSSNALDSVVTGKAHNSVQTLDSTNFDEAINDPANGLWFLKFYAPWCGHCKQLAPTLDAVAPYLEGKMAFGKIDCTSTSDAKSFCKGRFGVRGYPTLKIFRDGDFFPYPGNRDADSIISFGEKMAMHPVSNVVKTFDSAVSNILDDEKAEVEGVAFMAYDQNAEVSDNVDEILTSTKALQVFGQVARKLQATASFGLIYPDIEEEELKKFGITKEEGPILMKVEKDVGTVKYDGETNSADFVDFVNEKNVALVSKLDGKNFRQLGNMNKKLAIIAVNPNNDEKTKQFVGDFKNFAKSADSQITDEYIFASIDGKKWKQFLTQFSITPKDLPQLFLLDVSEKLFWQNSTITGFPEFFEAVASGVITPQAQLNNSKKSGFLARFQNWFSKNQPQATVLIGLALLLPVFGLVLCLSEDGPADVIESKKND